MPAVARGRLAESGIKQAQEKPCLMPMVATPAEQSSHLHLFTSSHHCAFKPLLPHVLMYSHTHFFA
eukprot:scaffold526_cov230-Pinguiococcus_pyrenoidosus.AAC.7